MVGFFVGVIDVKLADEAAKEKFRPEVVGAARSDEDSVAKSAPVFRIADGGLALLLLMSDASGEDLVAASFADKASVASGGPHEVGGHVDRVDHGGERLCCVLSRLLTRTFIASLYLLSAEDAVGNECRRLPTHG